jgi:hypothetical protein
MRFFPYRARGDKAIPPVAIDWPNFHELLRSLSANNIEGLPPTLKKWL